MLVSTDMEKAIKDFVGQQAKKYKHLGFDSPEDCIIDLIDGSGDDSNF